ncbi:prolyl oligopeptidase family serine peptidase [Pedobacter sp. SL55]|uniref:S9 family peptidase n=1 Tax=Pedobacter sp. SL55 TaxID=2995161 RepID=UPI0022700A40|nr:prolyl oligopeptidase family serine peptidase [Pedobacter sp. SL55]WAC41331.1 prolyl oligopeptidase family serine peptidase [Pedobacter sp. SL55]
MMVAVKKYGWLLVVVALFACSREKKVREIPVNDFFKTQDRALYRLSPNGKYLSYLTLKDKKQHLVVQDLEKGATTEVSKLEERNINFYCWVSNDELIYYKEKDGTRFQTDLYIVNKNGTEERLLNADEKSKVRLLEDQLIDDKFLLVTSNKRDSTVFDVYRLNVRNGQMVIAAKNPGNFTNWLTDSKGKLRMAISSDGVNESFWYRENETKAFQKIITNNFKTTLWPVAFSESKPNIVYAISNVNRDKNALIEIDCTNGKEKNVLFANDTLNVVEAQYSKRRAKMDFVVYETWKKEKHYLNEEAKQLFQNLEKLIPDAESRIIHSDKKEQHFIVRTFTDRSPGAYYLYYAENNFLKKLSDINPSIKEEEMCEMKPISYLTADGFKINGYLTLPLGLEPEQLPVVVIPHNGPGQRNSWGFNSDVQFLANRGYAVLQVNYRGSTGYGKEFYAAGFKEWGQKIQQDVDAGVQWLIDQKIADPQRVAIYGYGFGGLVAINSAVANPKMYKCAGSSAGVLNLFSYLKTIPPFLTANLQMFYEMVGNPDKDAEYMRQASPVFHADKVKIPIFITQNSKDPRINGNDAVQFVKELKKLNSPVTYLEKEDNKSVLNREEARKKSYAALELFLKDNLRKR